MYVYMHIYVYAYICICTHICIYTYGDDKGAGDKKEPKKEK